MEDEETYYMKLKEIGKSDSNEVENISNILPLLENLTILLANENFNNPIDESKKIFFLIINKILEITFIDNIPTKEMKKKMKDG